MWREGRDRKGKGAASFPHSHRLLAQVHEQLPCPRLPHLGGESFSSTEGLQARHQKADGKEQVIFIPMNSALLFRFENLGIILLFPHSLCSSSSCFPQEKRRDLEELGSVNGASWV